MLINLSINQCSKLKILITRLTGWMYGVTMCDQTDFIYSAECIAGRYISVLTVTRAAGVHTQVRRS